MKEYKPDWKQWLPIYGFYKSVKDRLDEKSSLINTDHPIRYIVSFLYHGSILGGIILGLEKLLQ